MSKKSRILITSYACVFAVFTLIGVGVSESRQQYYQSIASNSYDRAFYEFVSTVSNMDTALEKSLYMTDKAALSGAYMEVYANAMSAQMAIEVLPFDEGGLENTSSFLSKIADFSYYLARNVQSGGISDDNREAIKKLSEISKKLSGGLYEIYADAARHDGGIISLSSKYDDISRLDSITGNDAMKSITDIEAEFPEMPRLIYDGPFSDDVDTGAYSMLNGKEEITEDAGLKTVSDISSYDDLKHTGVTESDIKLHVYENDSARFEVSALGGHMVTMKSYGGGEDSSIDINSAIEYGRKYLEQCGYPNMVNTYYMITGNDAVINYAYKNGDYICYPDLIKVRVSLHDGTVYDIDASHYIKNHKERDIPPQSFKITDKSKYISSDLRVISEGLAVIPTKGKKEVYCYEFKCENSEGRHYIIYVNTQTGAQEDILILLESENGTLTI